MANIKKSFNFRNGVQVDDSNFIVNTSGLVGIGTDDPQAALHVEGSQVYLPDQWVFASDTDTMIRRRTSNSIEFRLDGFCPAAINPRVEFEHPG